MIRFAQRAIVRLDVGPIRRVFHAIYALGLRVLLRRLSAMEAVHSIYGCGSFFEGRCLHGHSDIDLVIVLGPRVARVEGGHIEVARAYARVRRLFPFLGRWDEKEGSLVFLEELEAGFPVPASFVLRWKQRRLHRLDGPDFPVTLPGGGIDAYDVACEASTLLCVAGGTREELARRLLFWKRLFGKLIDLAEALPIAGWAEELRARPEFAFLGEGDRALFFRRGDPEPLFAEFLGAVQAVFAALGPGDETVRHQWRDADGAPFVAQKVEPPVRIRSLAFSSGAEVKDVRAVASLPLGPIPELLFFPLGGVMPVVEAAGSPYRALRRLMRTLKRSAAEGEALVLRLEGLLVVLSRQATYVELVPLDPLRYADVYAHLRGESSWETPAAVDAVLRATSDQLFAALEGVYRRHDHWIPKAPFPCVYREEDADTLSDAFSILRVRAATSDGVCLRTPSELAAWLGCRYPSARPFLDDLMHYRRFLAGQEAGRPPAGNLIRCLHQFMAQALAGAPEIELDDPRRRLDLTVAIVTRNRARDLVGSLESLASQSRPPDQVVVVDNGSSDDTRAVVERFSERLPLRYEYLADASIPGARNLAIESASGEVVAFTDDDAACERDWLASIERGFLRAENVGLVGGWVEHWPHEKETLVDAYYERFHNSKT